MIRLHSVLGTGKTGNRYDVVGMSSPSQGMTFSGFEKTNLNICHFNWKSAIGHKNIFFEV